MADPDDRPDLEGGPPGEGPEEPPEERQEDRQEDQQDDRQDDRRLLEEAMAGVVPLAGRERRRPPAKKPDRRQASPGAAPSRRSPARRFEIRRDGDRVEGAIPGFEPSLLARLRTGEIEADLRVDLHGYPAQEARYELRSALGRAWAARYRCVLVIHGHGSRSPGAPVLKDNLPRWLAEAPHGKRIVAFTTAPPHRGGAGATLVLLRKQRRG